MKRPHFWLTIGTILVLFLGYVAVTSGTRYLLPSSWKQIKVGMPAEEGIDLLKSYKHGYDSSDSNFYSFHFEKSIGLRKWAIVAYYDMTAENKPITKTFIAWQDPHEWIVVKIGKLLSLY